MIEECKEMIANAVKNLTSDDGHVTNDGDGHILEMVTQITNPSQDDDCKLYLFTQSQLLKLVKTLIYKDDVK